jgi:hypothetical protein
MEYSGMLASPLLLREKDSLQENLLQEILQQSHSLPYNYLSLQAENILSL